MDQNQAIQQLQNISQQRTYYLTNWQQIKSNRKQYQQHQNKFQNELFKQTKQSFINIRKTSLPLINKDLFSTQKINLKIDDPNKQTINNFKIRKRGIIENINKNIKSKIILNNSSKQIQTKIKNLSQTILNDIVQKSPRITYHTPRLNVPTRKNKSKEKHNSIIQKQQLKILPIHRKNQQINQNQIISVRSWLAKNKKNNKSVIKLLREHYQHQTKKIKSKNIQQLIRQKYPRLGITLD